MLTLWRVALLLQLLGQPCSNINGALWQLARLPCFWWTFSRQWRAKGLAMLATGIIEELDQFGVYVCDWTLNDRFCIMVSLSSGSESTFWSINRDGNIYFYVVFFLCVCGIECILSSFCIVVVEETNVLAWKKNQCILRYTEIFSP